MAFMGEYSLGPQPLEYKALHAAPGRFIELHRFWRAFGNDIPHNPRLTSFSMTVTPSHIRTL